MPSPAVSGDVCIADDDDVAGDVGFGLAVRIVAGQDPGRTTYRWALTMVPELIVPFAVTEMLLVEETSSAVLEAKIPEAAELIVAAGGHRHGNVSDAIIEGIDAVAKTVDGTRLTGKRLLRPS